ncbi:ribosome biogenesis factor YjgA [Aliikangiella sp. IMCC44653]
MTDDDSQIDSDYSLIVSKTQKKNEAKALQNFGKRLIELSESKLELLPLSDNTIAAVKDFHKQSGNIAKRRHLAYIGKCLRNEDTSQVLNILEGENFDNLRHKSKVEDDSPKTDQVTELLEGGDGAIEALLQNNPQLDRQTLRQFARNWKNAKTQPKKDAAKSKLQAYLNEITISS